MQNLTHATSQVKGKPRLKTGIKITNPLSLPVQVKLISKTGALLIGVGHAASRIIKPGETLTVGTKGKCVVDINVTIIRYDKTGNYQKAGDGGFSTAQPLPQPGHMSKFPTPKNSLAGPVILANKTEVMFRHWKIVQTWQVPSGYAGILRSVEIRLTSDAEARIELPNNVTPRHVGGGTAGAGINSTLQYQNTIVTAGNKVKVVGRSAFGKGGEVEAIIHGELYPVGQVPLTKKPPKRGVRPAVEPKEKSKPEEPELRSLGDMIEDMRKKEDGVKV